MINPISPEPSSWLSCRGSGVKGKEDIKRMMTPVSRATPNKPDSNCVWRGLSYVWGWPEFPRCRFSRKVLSCTVRAGGVLATLLRSTRCRACVSRSHAMMCTSFCTFYNFFLETWPTCCCRRTCGRRLMHICSSGIGHSQSQKLRSHTARMARITAAFLWTCTVNWLRVMPMDTLPLNEGAESAKWRMLCNRLGHPNMRKSCTIILQQMRSKPGEGCCIHMGWMNTGCHYDIFRGLACKAPAGKHVLPDTCIPRFKFWRRGRTKLSWVLRTCVGNVRMMWCPKLGKARIQHLVEANEHMPKFPPAGLVRKVYTSRCLLIACLECVLLLTCLPRPAYADHRSHYRPARLFTVLVHDKPMPGQAVMPHMEANCTALSLHMSRLVTHAGILDARVFRTVCKCLTCKHVGIRSDSTYHLCVLTLNLVLDPFLALPRNGLESGLEPWPHRSDQLVADGTYDDQDPSYRQAYLTHGSMSLCLQRRGAYRPGPQLHDAGIGKSATMCQHVHLVSCGFCISWCIAVLLMLLSLLLCHTDDWGALSRLGALICVGCPCYSAACPSLMILAKFGTRPWNVISPVALASFSGLESMPVVVEPQAGMCTCLRCGELLVHSALGAAHNTKCSIRQTNCLYIWGSLSTVIGTCASACLGLLYRRAMPQPGTPVSHLASASRALASSRDASTHSTDGVDPAASSWSAAPANDTENRFRILQPTAAELVLRSVSCQLACFMAARALKGVDLS